MLHTPATPSRLRDEIAALEAKLIQGTATDDEIDRYVHGQADLAGATLLDAILDPRD